MRQVPSNFPQHVLCHPCRQVGEQGDTVAHRVAQVAYHLYREGAKALAAADQRQAQA
ncbi:hypothetical protein D3C80_2142490 [compost metagenome]